MIRTASESSQLHDVTARDRFSCDPSDVLHTVPVAVGLQDYQPRHRDILVTISVKLDLMATYENLNALGTYSVGKSVEESAIQPPRLLNNVRTGNMEKFACVQNPARFLANSNANEFWRIILVAVTQATPTAP